LPEVGINFARGRTRLILWLLRRSPAVAIWVAGGGKVPETTGSPTVMRNLSGDMNAWRVASMHAQRTNDRLHATIDHRGWQDAGRSTCTGLPSRSGGLSATRLGVSVSSPRQRAYIGDGRDATPVGGKANSRGGGR